MNYSLAATMSSLAKPSKEKLILSQSKMVRSVSSKYHIFCSERAPSLAFDKTYLNAFPLRPDRIASYISPASPVPSIFVKSSS